MSIILEVKHLVKKYKNITAVNDVSFSIRQGICFGLLGPNGAGKTTSIEVIEDVIPPTSGEILYKGLPRTASFRNEVGIQFQHTSLFQFLKITETLKAFQSLYEKTYDLDELMEICSLREIKDQINDKISGGQKQRLSLALALINDPVLLFLDEPSTGLDPQSRRNLWQIIQQIREQGKTIVLTTHYMEEAQELCDEIAIMDHGRFIAQGTPDELVKKHCNGVTVVLPKENLSNDDMSYLSCREVRGKIEIPTTDINSCLNELMTHRVDLREIIVRSPNLEDVFLKLTGRKLRD